MLQKTISNQVVFKVSLWLFFFATFLFAKHALGYGWSLAEGKPISSCFVVDKNAHILMVQDRATGKYHLPGGLIEDASEEETALWYMIRDTGFNAHIGFKIDQLVNHTVFACGILTPKDYFINHKGEKVVVSWLNLLASKEVGQPYLMPLNEETKRKYANPKELMHFEDWLSRAVPSRFILLENGVKMLPDYYQDQHTWIVILRDWALSFDLVSHIAKIFPSASVFLFPLVFILSMPFFRTYYGLRTLLIFSAGLVYLGLFSVILNKYFPIPPPFFVDHSFIPTQSFLYSFPANEVTFFSFVFSYLVLLWPNKRYVKERLYFMILGIFFVCISVLKTAIYGESYPSTILLSILVALACSFILKNVRNIRFSDRKRSLVTLRFWSFTTLLCAVIASLSETVRDDFIAAFCFSISFSVLMLKLLPNFTMSVRSEYRLKFFVSGVLGLLGLFYLSLDYMPEDVTQTNILIFKVIIVPIWLLVLHPALFWWLYLRRKSREYYDYD